jgi:hypothetical protein
MTGQPKGILYFNPTGGASPHFKPTQHETLNLLKPRFHQFAHRFKHRSHPNWYAPRPTIALNAF